MTIAAGTRLGPYEILGPLGAGGMGEVYRAEDMRVDRAVALKVLPEEFFEDEERRARFGREAKLLASLNHPGIAVLYSFEEIPGSSPSSSRHLLAMELVEGDDLAGRIVSGSLSLEESLPFARQIAEALEAAHEKGIVHRDLKPANVKITPDGRVKQAPEGTTLANSLALSPDGRRLAFVATDEKGVERLYVRPFETVVATPFPGTEGARLPFWSPDGNSLGFFMGDRLVRVSAAGGPPQTICTAADGRGGSWSSRDVIVFAPGTRLALQRVNAAGGVPSPVTTLAPGDYSHRWPEFLPDGVHFVYLSLSNEDKRLGIHAGSIEGPEDTFVVASRGRPDFDAGRLLYLRENTLFSQPFDLKRRALTGEPALVVDGIVPEGDTGWTGLAAFSGAADGTLAYRRRPSVRQQLAWCGRDGRTLGAIGDAAVIAEPFWFPGAQRLGLTVEDRHTDIPDLWQVDLVRGTWTRLTFGPKANLTGCVSPDGRWIYFSGRGTGRLSLRRRLLDGNAADELLFSSETDAYPDFVTVDRSALVYETSNSSGRYELWRLPLVGERKASLLLASPQGSVTHASTSPNGRFFAYSSDETGRSEVYFQRLPPSGGRWQISKDGGDQALWRGDGRELYFVSPDRRLMAVDVSLDGDVRAGEPRALFSLHVPPNGLTLNRSQYLPAPDGNRFLVLASVDEKLDRPAVVALNWPAMGGTVGR